MEFMRQLKLRAKYQQRCDADNIRLIKPIILQSLLKFFDVQSSGCISSKNKTIQKGFDPAKYATAKLPTETVSKLKEVFDVFDYDGSGNISVEELVNTIRALGLEDQAHQVLAIVNNSGHSGEMDFGAFLGIFGFHGDTNSESNLQQIFEEFDKDGKGIFGANEFEKVAAGVGQHFTPAQVDQIIEYADKDRDGGINFEQFLSVVTKAYPKV